MADHNTPQAVAERIKEWIGSYGGENIATLLLYEAMNALNGSPAASVTDAQPVAWLNLEKLPSGGGMAYATAFQVKKDQSALFTAPQPSSNPGPLAAVERDLLAALIDIHDDFKNNPPEARCYVDSAFDETLAEARAAIAASKEGASHGKS